MKPDLLAQLVEELKTFPLREQYESEEPDLLGHVIERISPVLPSDYQIIQESWKEDDCVPAFGGSFWPDILIRYKGQDILAFELKLAKHTAKSPAGGIKATLGQCCFQSA